MAVWVGVGSSQYVRDRRQESDTELRCNSSAVGSTFIGDRVVNIYSKHTCPEFKMTTLDNEWETVF